MIIVTGFLFAIGFLAFYGLIKLLWWLFTKGMPGTTYVLLGNPLSRYQTWEERTIDYVITDFDNDIRCCVEIAKERAKNQGYIVVDWAIEDGKITEYSSVYCAGVLLQLDDGKTVKARIKYRVKQINKDSTVIDLLADESRIFVVPNEHKGKKDFVRD